MESFWLVFNAAFPVYLAGAVGVGARLSGILTTEADQSLMRLTVNVLIPCLILRALLNNPVVNDLHNLFLAPLVGFSCLMIGYLEPVPYPIRFSERCFNILGEAYPHG